LAAPGIAWQFPAIAGDKPHRSENHHREFAMFGLIAKLFGSKTKSSSKPASTPKRAPALGVESLEDRTMPSTFTLSNGVLAVNIDENNAALKVTQSNGVVAIQGAPHGWYASAVHKIYVQGGPGTCSINLSGVQSIPAEIHGGSGNNYIYGTHTADLIYGGNGLNIMFGDGGNDEIHGRGSDNRLIAGPGYTKLYADGGLNFMDGAENRGGHAQYFAHSGARVYVAEAFTPGNVYSPTHIKQGSGCYTCNFLAVLEGMARSGVNFGSYIHYVGVNQYGQGLYNVSMYNGQQWISVRVVFSGETSTADNQPTVNQASWGIIMERAWLQFHGNRGGSNYEVMRALGRNPSEYTAGMFNSTAYFNQISYALSHGGVVAGGTKSAVSLNFLETTHAYAILGTGYNAAGVPCVKLRNPWGFNLVNDNPYQQYDAEVWITWYDFVRNFDELTIG
jgi:hypothetical protein